MATTAVVPVDKTEHPAALKDNNDNSTMPPAQSATPTTLPEVENEEEKEKRRLEREKLLAKRLLWYVDVATFLRVRYSCNAYWAEASDRVLEKDVEHVLAIAGQATTYGGSQPSSKSFLLSSFGMTLQNAAAAGSEQPRSGSPPQSTNYLSTALKAAVQATLDATTTSKQSIIGPPSVAAGIRQQQQHQHQTNQPAGFSTTGQHSLSTQTLHTNTPLSLVSITTTIPSLTHFSNSLLSFTFTPSYVVFSHPFSHPFSTLSRCHSLDLTIWLLFLLMLSGSFNGSLGSRTPRTPRTPPFGSIMENLPAVSPWDAPGLNYSLQNISNEGSNKTLLGNKTTNITTITITTATTAISFYLLMYLLISSLTHQPNYQV